MNRKRGGITLYLLLSSAIVLIAITAGATDDHSRAEYRHGQASPSAYQGHGMNPLIEKMHILDGVFREVVSAVSLGDGQRVRHGTVKLSKSRRGWKPS